MAPFFNFTPRYVSSGRSERAGARLLERLRLALATAESLFEEYAEFRRQRGEIDPVGLGRDSLQDVAVDQPFDIVEKFKSGVTSIAIDLTDEGSEQELHLDDQRVSLRIAFNGHVHPLQKLRSLAEAEADRKTGWHYWNGACWAACVPCTNGVPDKGREG